MQNLLFSKPIYQIVNYSANELEAFTKEIMTSPNIEEIEKNIKIFEILFKENYKQFQKEKCDIGYIFTLFSYHLLNKKHFNFFSKIFCWYANLFLEKNWNNSSFCVVYLFVKYQNVNIVFSYKECQQEYQNLLMNFENNKYSTVMGVSINSFSYSEISKRFFLIFLQDLSNFSNFKNFEVVFHFIKKNSLGIKNIILVDKNNFNNNLYYENYFKIINRILHKGFSLLDDSIHSKIETPISLISNFATDIIDNFLYGLNGKITDDRIFYFFFVIFTKFSIFFSKKKNLEKNEDFNIFFDKSVLYISNCILPNNHSQKALKTYSHLLGKIENIYTILNDKENINKYALEIINFYKIYKVVTVDLLLVKVNFYRNFLNCKKNNNVFGGVGEGYLEKNKENVIEIFILSNNCIIDDDEEKENFININTFFNSLLDFFILSEIQGNEKMINFNELYAFIENLYSLYTEQNDNLRLCLNNRKISTFINLLRVILEKDEKNALFQITEAFEQNEKKIENYFFIIAFFLTFQRKTSQIIKLLDLLRNKNSSSLKYDIKNFISLYNKVIFFCLKLEYNNFNFLFELMKILIKMFENNLNQSVYESINGTLEQFLFPNLTKLIISVFNSSYNSIIIEKGDSKQDKQNISVPKLNDLFKKLQSIAVYTNEIIKQFSFLNESSNFFVNSDICNYLYLLIFQFFEKIKTDSEKTFLIFAENPQVIDALTNKKETETNFIYYIIVSLAKYQYDLFQKKKEPSFFQYKNMISIFNELTRFEIAEDNINNANRKKIKSKIYFQLDYFFHHEINKPLLEEDFKYIEKSNSCQKRTINSKVQFLYSLIILSENIKHQLLLNKTTMFTPANLMIISSAIEFLKKNKNDEHKIILSAMKIIQLIEEVNINPNINNGIHDVIEYYENLVMNNWKYFLSIVEKIIIVKLLTNFLLLYEDNYKTEGQILKIKQLINSHYEQLKEKKESDGFNIYDYINNIDIRYYTYLSQTKSMTIPAQIEKGYDLLSEMIQLYQNLSKEKMKKTLSELESTRVKLLICYFSNSIKYKNNGNLLLLFTLDYQSIVLDLMKKLSNLSMFLFKIMFNNGFCDLILKSIHSFDKILLLKYNESFYLNILTYLIKITRKYERKHLYNIVTCEHHDFQTLGEFKSWENELFILYLKAQYPTITIKKDTEKGYASILDIVRDNNIKKDDLINKYLSVRSNYIKFDNKKQIAIYIKNSICKEKNDIENEFFKLFGINEKNSITFYLTKFTDIQYKHEIKLIPYIFYDNFYTSLLNPPAIETIITISKGIITNKMKWNDYSKIKHIKKIIKELIYFSSVSDDVELTNKLIGFYIKYLHNFKYNFDLSGASINEDKKANLIVLFRIKHYIYFYIEYNKLSTYNKIDTSKEDVINVFNNFSNSIHIVQNKNKTIRGNFIEKVENELREYFFKLQNLLICSNKNISDTLQKIFEDKKEFNEYLEKKIVKYSRYFPISKQEMISWLFEAPKDNLLNKSKQKNKSKSKKKINLNETVSISDYKLKFISKFYCSNKPFKFSLSNHENDFFYYIPSGELSQLPIENLPLLFNFPIIRTNSYLYIYNNNNKNDIILKPSDLFYLLNPSGDLKDSEKYLYQFFTKNNIPGIKGYNPSEKELISNLTQKKMFIYCGHGDATKFISLDHIKHNHIAFLTFLFGCSSGNVSNITGRDTQPFGLPHYYLMNGCPFFLGFLWTVTSKDLDKLLMDIFTNIISNNKNSSLISNILIGKRFISRRYLNGSALVVYGNNDLIIKFCK